MAHSTKHRPMERNISPPYQLLSPPLSPSPLPPSCQVFGTADRHPFKPTACSRSNGRIFSLTALADKTLAREPQPPPSRQIVLSRSETCWKKTMISPASLFGGGCTIQALPIGQHRETKRSCIICMAFPTPDSPFTAKEIDASRRIEKYDRRFDLKIQYKWTF